MLDGILTQEWDAAWDAVMHLILPAIALGTIPLAIIVRITRASVLEVMDEDYVRTAEAKGLRHATVSRRHVMRNALLPVVTTIGLQTGLLLSGAVLTETVFAFNGIGQYLFEAITQRDYPVLQGFILFIALIYCVINLAVDVALRRHRPEGEGRVSVHACLPDPAGPRPRLGRPTSTSSTTSAASSLWRGAVAPAAPQPDGDHRRGSSSSSFVLVAIFAPLLAPYEPARRRSGPTRSRRPTCPGPSEEHRSGSTASARDLLHPARLRRPAVAAHRRRLHRASASSVGAALGLLAGRPSAAWVGRHVVMRLVDIMLSIPSLLLAVSIAAVLGRTPRRHDRHRGRAGPDLRPAAARVHAVAARTTTSWRRPSLGLRQAARS